MTVPAAAGKTPAAPAGESSSSRTRIGLACFRLDIITAQVTGTVRGGTQLAAALMLSVVAVGAIGTYGLLGVAVPSNAAPSRGGGLDKGGASATPSACFGRCRAALAYSNFRE